MEFKPLPYIFRISVAQKNAIFSSPLKMKHLYPPKGPLTLLTLKLKTLTLKTTLAKVKMEMKYHFLWVNLLELLLDLLLEPLCLHFFYFTLHVKKRPLPHKLIIMAMPLLCILTTHHYKKINNKKHLHNNEIKHKNQKL